MLAWRSVSNFLRIFIIQIVVSSVQQVCLFALIICVRVVVFVVVVVAVAVAIAIAVHFACQIAPEMLIVINEIGGSREVRVLC